MARMSFRDALDLVPDDLPDGAYFALAHDIAGLEYGEGFGELAEEGSRPKRRQKSKRLAGTENVARSGMPPKPFICLDCTKRSRRFATEADARRHWQDVHGRKS